MSKKADGDKAVTLKDEGNVFFKKGDFNEAINKYSQGISHFQPTLQLLNNILAVG
jgi:hypothetical protein